MSKNGFRVLDSDMHVLEPPDLWQRYIDPRFRDRAPQGVTSENVTDLRTVMPGLESPPAAGRGNIPGGHNYHHNQARYAAHAARGFTAECQLEAMDVEGIDVAVLFPSRGLSILTFPSMEPPFAAAIARAYNDWMADFCRADPRRLIGSGMLSVWDVEDAVAEAQRAVKELGFRAVFLRSNIANGKVWHDPYYEPLWKVLEELAVPLGFHEATGSRSRQVGEEFVPNFGLRRIYSQPVTQMIGLGSFLGGGVLARHPDLKVAFLEANCSWAPWLLWRLDESYELEGDVFMPHLSMPPSEYFKRQCWISIEPDETPARHMIQDFGCDQLVFSTDYPHSDSRYPHAVESFLELDLPDGDKRKILWDNCARFYAID
jgi:predicted TIM-barrel fold metal-dependent hydrolase